MGINQLRLSAAQPRVAQPHRQSRKSRVLSFLVQSRMDFDTLEIQALGLPVKDRARLVQDLLESLDELTPEEVQSLWPGEAERRADQIDRGEVSFVSAESVAL
jgi:putative addiction module component (TIGR02574 family)